LSNTATVSYCWSKKGKQPKICQPQRKKERRTIFGCVCPCSGELVTQVSKQGNMRNFFSFLLKVSRTFKGKKVYMVLDNVRFHHAKRLVPILEKYRERIEFVFLPPYSPDLNPIERVWWLMRKQITHNRWSKTMEQRIKDFEQWTQMVSTGQIKAMCNLTQIPQ
jgi:putative transposase